MPFEIHGDEVPAGVVPQYDGVPETSALTYDWSGTGWTDAEVEPGTGVWRVLMCSSPMGRHMASYKVAKVLLRLKESRRPTFGHVLVAWRPAGGALVEVGLLWSDAAFVADVGSPPWMSVNDLGAAGLLASRRLADVEEVMES